MEKSALRWSPRQIVRNVITAAFLLIIAPVVGDFFTAMAGELGLYTSPVQRMRDMVAMAQSVFGDQGFYWLAFGLGGLASGLWLDALLRQIMMRFGNFQETQTRERNLADVLSLIELASSRERLIEAKQLLLGAPTEVLFIKYSKENFLHRRENWNGEACRVNFVNIILRIETLLELGNPYSTKLNEAAASRKPARFGEDQIADEGARREYRKLFHVEDTANWVLRELTPILTERATRLDIEIKKLGDRAQEAVDLVSIIRKSAVS